MEFREIFLQDEKGIEELSSLATEIIREYYDPLLGKTQNDYMIELFQSVPALKRQLQEGSRYYLVKDGRNIGFIGFYPKKDTLYLAKFYIRKEERRKGYGRKMMAKVFEEAREYGLPSVSLNVNRYNEGSIAFYESLGFTRIREEDNDIGGGFYMNDYVYEKSVNEDGYLLKIAGLERRLPFVDIGKDLAYASFVMISDSELVSAVAPLLAEKIGDVDYIVTAEAKGIALAHEVTKCLGKKEFIVARKSEKSYMRDSIEVYVDSITTKGIQKLIFDGSDLKKVRGKRVCLLDDVISTGSSLHALEALALKAGAIVEKKACVLAEGEAFKRKDILSLGYLPLLHKENGIYTPIEV